MNEDKELLSYIQCSNQAQIIIDNPNIFKNWNNITDVELLTGILYNLKEEREEHSAVTDTYIDYNDEIVSIEECDEMELMDITVSGDNLFYINDIVTKNSHGISMTADLMFGLISTPELEQLGHLRVKQLKNRFGNLFAPNSFLIGAHRAKMTLFDVDLPLTLSTTANIYAKPIRKAEENEPETMFSGKPVIKNKLKF